MEIQVLFENPFEISMTDPGVSDQITVNLGEEWFLNLGTSTLVE
jgi:hypothetical protein